VRRGRVVARHSSILGDIRSWYGGKAEDCGKRAVRGLSWDRGEGGVEREIGKVGIGRGISTERYNESWETNVGNNNGKRRFYSGRSYDADKRGEDGGALTALWNLLRCVSGWITRGEWSSGDGTERNFC